MRSRSFTAFTLLVVAAGTGCAHASQGASEQSVAVQAASGQLGAAYLEWSGKFRPTQQQSLGVEMRTLNVASGTVSLTAPDERQMHVRLSELRPGS